jgi:hypothetical protein
MRGVRLTPEQREELLALYLTDRAASRRMARALGVSRSYCAELANRRGLKSALPFKNRGAPKYSEDANDPRWRWAIERGAVVA